MIPAPTSIDYRDSSFSIDQRPLRVSGPAWIGEVASAIGESPFFPTLEIVRGGQVDVRIEAPEQVTLLPEGLPDSSYSLTVAREAIGIVCEQPAGLIAALRTLHALRDENGYRGAVVHDAPAFGYRGLHLDVCRHFFGASFVKRVIHLAAALGLNVFHWHLTEDQGWRLPVPAYPRLTEVGGYRTEADGSRYGGHYNREEILDVVRYAGAHGVLVIPEIETPGHARAAIAAYPELSCRGEPVSVWNRWGICEDVFCAGNDVVFSFLDKVYAEVADLFPSRYVHIGGDECPKSRWKECSRCQDRMRQEGLATEEELQSYFISRAASLLESRGKIAIGWDEILEGGLPGGTVVMSWRGTAGGIEAAELGHEVIMTPTSHCYFDYRQLDRDGEIGLPYAGKSGRPPFVTLEQVYAFDPIAGLDADAARNVLGGQANVWTEQLSTESEVEYMIAPRLLALSEVLWSGPSRPGYTDFRERLPLLRERLSRYGWTVGPI